LLHLYFQKKVLQENKKQSHYLRRIAKDELESAVKPNPEEVSVQKFIYANDH